MKRFVIRQKYQEELKEIDDVKKQNDYLDKILPEAYALVREGSKRVFNMIPFKVQVMGGIAIHKGDIAEMRTGEGKTLTAHANIPQCPCWPRCSCYYSQ